MRDRIEIVKSSDGKIQTGTIYIGSNKKLSFVHEYDDTGLLRAITFAGHPQAMPTAVELYNLLNNQFIEVAKILHLPPSETSPDPVLDVRMVEGIQTRPITSRRRTGTAFFIDTFDEYTASINEKWYTIEGTPSISTDYPKQGLKSLKLSTGVLADDDCAVGLYMGPPKKSRFGFEFEFMSLEPITNLRSIYCSYQYYDGVRVLTGEWIYLGETNKRWQYLTNAGIVDLQGGNQDIGFYDTWPAYHNAKFIVDFDAKKYDMFYCDDREFDMSAIPLVNTASTNPPALAVSLSVRNAVGGAARALYVDNLILTDKEP